MALTFLPIPTGTARALRDGPDAYGLPPERIGASDGIATPCRHCLAQVPEGQPYLIAAHRPFCGLNPYTETGPIFLCAAECVPGGPGFPTRMLTAPSYIVRGYTADERILYGTGSVVATSDIPARCEALFQDDRIAFIHIRSASNNCFQCRVERA
ncbi:DUF1203 domain-containing protein [Paracoccus sp. TK19116]|uniref:DUF1203 domain-containing protein n=1 Tax=Paracoccus albicereus TaxID=2922394 RepID=A0ABT1MN19_9RHOB|nr:DUF1203 domain-containing protein [Paracoccus albicereus]MCQ0969683.1 DUF1203 domain-containing protein [Paracoccus albicereus]